MNFFAKIRILWSFSQGDEKAIILLILIGSALIYYNVVIKFEMINSPGLTFVLLAVGGPFFLIGSIVVIYKVYVEAHRRHSASLTKQK